jgi:transposase
MPETAPGIPMGAKMDMVMVNGWIREGQSLRGISKRLGISRNTLKKRLLEQDDPGFSLFRTGKLEAYFAAIGDILAREPFARAVEIHRRLADQGYQGSYDLVKRRVRSLRQEVLNPARPSQPGRRADADLDRVEAGGRACFLFTLTMAHSRRIYAELLEKPDLEAFLDCHQRAFRFFQGVPAEVAYERVRNKWVKRLTGSGGFNLPLTRFATHCGFLACDAPPAAPWAAGRLKRPLRLVEAAFLRGYPLESLSAANSSLLAWLLAREAMPFEGEGGPSIQDRFSDEQPVLGPLPKTPWAKFTPRLAPSAPSKSTVGGGVHDHPLRGESGEFPERREAESLGMRRTSPPSAG